ncbi:hypothetical protein TorRG33x02_322990 [Trema orientale]|uniref:Uncharacterized protein n=1 Tax=Trema orientale TaxID=63057 RepID=A0A2P5BFJ9_TREOI|nr:hypothetical protein TorRG33x02_322990 [Trema orientale]
MVPFFVCLRVTVLYEKNLSDTMDVSDNSSIGRPVMKRSEEEKLGRGEGDKVRQGEYIRGQK